MHFSFFHLMPYTHLEQPPREWPAPNGMFDPVKGKALFDSYIDTLAFADECGFDWVGCNEHHFSPYGLMANCNLVGSALTQRTSRVGLAMLGNLIPLLNPIRVAEEYAMLDVMSGGRLIAGFIRGVAHEYIAYNMIPDESRGRLREAIALILKAWTEPEPFGWEGEYYQYPSVSIWPRPYQQPHPKILLSASNEESAEFAGVHARYKPIVGMTLIADLKVAARCLGVFRSVSRSNGFDPTPADILTGHQTCIADSDEEAREAMRRGLDYFNTMLMQSLREAQRLVIQKTRFFSDDKQSQGFVNKLQTLKQTPVEDLIEAGSILCGSPASVVKQAKRIQAELGNGHMQLNMKIGDMPDSVVRRSMELFRDQVQPQLKDL